MQERCRELMCANKVKLGIRQLAFGELKLGESSKRGWAISRYICISWAQISTGRGTECCGFGIRVVVARIR